MDDGGMDGWMDDGWMAGWMMDDKCMEVRKTAPDG